ncbi:putative GTPase activating protein [Leptomonas pyrrhocoris]|uniref:Putative GTPase activating protein n=1 Tax=Leptomonas pyrrhocoris TaxID=157538 RepID=A0A0M9G6C7_LEPPY|nr:putative GTPase activating protein [Leptomonas pyrrhocoris]XP_015661596.1 putative GTPase activating protein [Leptomonas pyrrhocoris]KPA83156.1 putative GTPase activating protein [Leptomonas pyrrhocoris]KPA83157.1 putative GTPase activating protein [Leptomonas pyrrhocoris]|eukprot:XP_015661595.1 putative GTPase activating protein [Leptomonas pyrrhocoris]
MYSSFLERVLGYSPFTTATANKAEASSSAASENSTSDSAAPRLCISDSTQYRATTRPYHCSQNQVPRVRTTGLSKADGDSCAPTALERGSNGSVNALLSGPPSSPSTNSANKPNKSPKLAINASRSSGERSNTPLPAPSGSFRVHKLLPHAASASSTGLDTMATSSAVGGLTTSSAITASSAEQVKRFETALRADPADVDKLRELSWQGCPVHLRYEVWMFLTGCWSPQAATRMPTVSRRRIEYAAYIRSSYGTVDWDAVCALVDSGVDTAVRRSTLKAVDTAPAGEVQPREPALTTVAGQTSLQATPLTPALATEKRGGLKGAVEGPPGANAAASVAPLQPRRSPRGLQHSSVSLEDVQSLLAQSPKLACSAPSLEAPGMVANASFNSAINTSTTTTYFSPSPKQLPAADSRTFSTSKSTFPTTTSTAKPLTGTSTGHQLSASTMLGSKELQTLKQIRKDIPRMSGGRSYLRHPRVQGSIERILFIWSLRHPACGYVQGMNDLVVPFMAVVLAAHFCPTRSITELHSYTADILEELWSPTAVPVTQWINELEAEVYWLTSYLLNVMQDNYTSSHEGITAMMRHLAAVVQAADPPLYHDIVDTLHLHFEHFSFRWMNCLLLRELTETQSLRLLDAYLSDEERRWSLTHVYVCAALLLRWSPQLLGFGDDYISALKFLQAPPTEQMSLRDFQDVLSESFVLQSLYEASLLHLTLSLK